MTRAELEQRKAQNPHLYLNKKAQSVYLIKEAHEERIAACHNKMISAR